MKKTKRELQIQMADLRLSIRKGELPYTFIDNEERKYRQEVYRISKEIGKKLSCTKVNDVWTIDIA